MELVLKGRRAFRPYRLRTQRYAVLVAHRRCGKTVACVQGLIRQVHDPYPATWPLRLRSVKLPQSDLAPLPRQLADEPPRLDSLA
jgi:hypothetical protein